MGCWEDEQLQRLKQPELLSTSHHLTFCRLRLTVKRQFRYNTKKEAKPQ